ncbi:MAG: hypothetical protein PHD81_00505 [Candidatus Nanoarchaeia archaeon]|nr:hypothetical protein [Candidatus Nanoarchaeia archaeon]MDD5587570.1 hypothetical protein [Candidatus Nanoarchaeia archaeon]
MIKQQVEEFYNKHYKLLMILPLIVVALSLISIVSFYAKTGDIINKDITLKGGISATIYTEKQVNTAEIEKELVDASVRTLTDLSTGKQIGILVEVSGKTSDELKSYLEKKVDLTLDDQNYSVEETGPSLGSSFYSELLMVLFFAFILMGITVFITFRNFIPSIAVIQAAFGDMVIALAAVNLMGMKISSAGIVAFLLVIGYSIDTDILLTTKALKKHEGKLFDRMWGAMKTGITMVLTAMAALTVAIIFSNSVVIKEMFTIILIALFADLFTTFFTNAGIVTWYCKKKGIQ